MKAVFLGIDLGSTALKVVISDGRSRIIAAATVRVAIERPQPGYAEQRPEAWWRALISACKSLNLKDYNVSGLSFSGQMHGAVLLDDRDQVLRPAILWNDSRAVKEALQLQQSASAYAAQAGVNAMASFVAPKLLWIRSHEPRIFGQIDCVIAPKDYLRLRMTGVRASDPVDGCGMWLLDAGRRQWSPEIAAAAGISPGQLPKVYEATAPAGALLAGPAKVLGLRAGIPVITGTGDAAASAIGLGVVEEGEGVISMGTAAQIIVVKSRHVPNPARSIHAYCFGLPGKWFQMAALLDGASPLAWAAGLLGETDIDRLLRGVALAMGQKPRLLALPYLSGIRTPHDDPLMRAAVAGLGAETGRHELVRAILESVALSLADCYQHLAEGGGAPDSLLIVGGGARSRLWTQMIANALGRNLLRAEASDYGAAVGAARLARLGVLDEPFKKICIPPRRRELIKPQRAVAADFARRLAPFRQFYQSIKDIR